MCVKFVKTTKWTVSRDESEKERVRRRNENSSHWTHFSMTNICRQATYNYKPLPHSHTNYYYKTDWMQYLPLLVWLKLLSKNVKKNCSFSSTLCSILWAVGIAIVHRCPILCVHHAICYFSFSLSLPTRPISAPYTHIVFPVQSKIFANWCQHCDLVECYI